MSIFSIALFLHIVGALGVAVALGLEWTGLRQIRSALLPEQVRAWMEILKSTNKLGSTSMLATVITGFYMVLTAVGWVPWILVVLGALVLAMVLARVLTAPRLAIIGHALATEKGSISQTFHNRVNDPVLWSSIQTRAAIVLGIIFLKVATPGLGGSLLTMGIAIVLGLASTLPMLRSVRIHRAQAE